MRTLAALIVATIAGTAHADEPSIYTGVFTKDTVAFGEIDVTQLTPDRIREAVLAVMDFEALSALELEFNPEQRIKPMLDQLGQMGVLTAMLTGSGATTINIVMQMPEDADEPTLFVLFPTNGEQAAQQLSQFAGMMGAQSGMVASIATEADDQDNSDHWVILHQPGSSYEGTRSPERQRQLQDAMNSMGDWTLKFAFAPTLATRDLAIANAPEEPVFARAAVQTMMSSQWMGMWLDLGAKPQVGFGAQLADEGDAQKFSTAYGQAMGMLSERARKTDADIKENDEDFSGPLPSHVADLLISACELEHAGSRVRITLDDAELRELVTTGVHFAAVAADAFGEALGESLDIFGRE